MESKSPIDIKSNSTQSNLPKSTSKEEIHISYKEICDHNGFCLIQIMPENKAKIEPKPEVKTEVEVKQEVKEPPKEVVITVQSQTKKVRSAFKARRK